MGCFAGLWAASSRSEDDRRALGFQDSGLMMPKQRTGPGVKSPTISYTLVLNKQNRPVISQNAVRVSPTKKTKKK